MISRRNMKRHTMLIALFTAFAMLFAIGLAAPVQALSLGSVAPELSGTTTKVTVNVEAESLPEDLAILSILDSLSLNITQIADQSADDLNAYFNLDVLREEQVALSLGVLSEGGKVLVDIPQLFDTLLAVDLQAFLEEVLAGSLDGSMPLAGLQDLDVEALGTTLMGILTIVEAHTPEITEGETFDYAIFQKSATLLEQFSTYDGEALTAIVQEIAEFLGTDEGMASLFENVIQPMSEDDYTNLDDFLQEFLGDAADTLQNAELTIGTYIDENEVTAGYHFALAQANDEYPDAEALVLDLFLLGEQDDFEAEILVAADGELARIEALGGISEEGVLNGTLTLNIHEDMDKASNSQTVLMASLVNVELVPFANAMMVTGTIEVVAAAEGEEIRLRFGMTEDDGVFTGTLDINNLFSLGLELRELADDELVIPDSFKTKEVTLIESADALEALLTEDVQMRLFGVLDALGIPLEDMLGE